MSLLRQLALSVVLISELTVCAAPWGVTDTGVSLDGVDASGAAILTALPAGAKTITFAADVSIGQIELSGGTVEFRGASGGSRLTVGGAQSGFALTDVSAVFHDITFVGRAESAETVYDGAAISCWGGSLSLADCTFTNGCSRFTGGAVSALLMTDDVVISNCTFCGNRSGPVNGMGGALYASCAPGVTANLVLTDCTFRDNQAQNGGAIATVRVVDDDEMPMDLVLTRCTLANNTADYNGGAADVEGDALLSDTRFLNNTAKIQGGAICAGTSDADFAGATLEVKAGTVFRGNSAANTIANRNYWTSGGAVSLASSGYALTVTGREIVFDGNKATCGIGANAYGGAVYGAEGTTMDFSRIDFRANEAQFAGGAVFSQGTRVTVGTSIFSNNVIHAAAGYGGAVAIEGATLTLSNTTVRGSNPNALDVYAAKLSLVNCVVADNGRADISVTGAENGAFDASFTAWGLAEIATGIPLATNACLSGIGTSVYLNETLRLNAATRYNPVAAEGLVQTATDYEDVAYGSRPEGFSMGAYECGTPKYDPTVRIDEVVWYHNRTDGFYYPQIKMTVVDGDASRIEGVTLACGDTQYELPSNCVEQLTAATAGQTFSFGVNPATFVVFEDDKPTAGFVPPADRLFGVSDKTRPVTLDVEVTATLRLAEVTPVAQTVRTALARTLSQQVPVAATFSDFSVGNGISGRTEVPFSAQVTLYGCTTLGSSWVDLGTVVPEADGTFAAEVPAAYHFFKLMAEVPR